MSSRKPGGSRLEEPPSKRTRTTRVASKRSTASTTTRRRPANSLVDRGDPQLAVTVVEHSEADGSANDLAEMAQGTQSASQRPSTSSTGVQLEQPTSSAASTSVELANQREENVSAVIPSLLESDSISRLARVLENTFHAMRDASRDDSNARLLNRISIKNLPIFSGDPLEWLHFKQAYASSSEAGAYTDRENVSRLFLALRGEARASVSSLLATGQGADEVMSSLEMHFGDKKVLARKLVAEINELPSLTSGQISLTHFATKLKNSVSAFKSLNLVGYLHSPDLIQSIASKIPTALQVSYNAFAETTTNDNTELEKLAEFLYRQAQLAISGGIFQFSAVERRATSTKLAPVNHKPQRVYVTSHEEKRHMSSRVNAGYENDRDQCVVCRRDNHFTADCSRFARESIDRRWFFVKDARLCFKCLKRGHLQSKCEARNCPECGKPHHALLHNAARAGNPNRPENDRVNLGTRSGNASLSSGTNA